LVGGAPPLPSASARRRVEFADRLRGRARLW